MASKEGKLPQPLGYYEFCHEIQKGESISAIAARYRAAGWPVKGWHPIWLLNSRVYANLRNREDPDRIYPHDVLIMPRSDYGYAAAIDRLKQLHRAVQSDNSVTAELKNIGAQASKWESQVNLAGTIATFTVGLALKGVALVTASNRLKAAQVTGVRLEQMAAEKSIANVEFVVELVGGTVSTGADLANLSDANKNAAKAAKGVAGGIVDGKVQVFKGKSLATAIAHGLATAVVGSIDILKYANPGTLARKISGLDDELRRQQLYAESVRQQSLLHLSDKIAELQREWKVVHPDSAP